MDYLDKALTLLRERSYFSHRVDWDAITAQADALAAHAPSPADCYPLIRAAVEGLQDGHSFFIGADRKHVEGPQGKPAGYGLFILWPELVVTEVFPDSAGDLAGVRRGDVVEMVNDAPPIPQEGRRLVLNPDVPQRLVLRRGAEALQVELHATPIAKAPMPQGRYLGDGVGYLELFVQGNPAEAQQYIDTAQDIVRRAMRDGARGWIVDLRCDRGGNMWPMITGAGALMGDGHLGTFIDADGTTTRWFYHAGTSSYQEQDMTAPEDFLAATAPVPTCDPETIPVAVLTSEFTGSSGEMTLISFLGRPNTRTFGGVTKGEITGVGTHELEDGALLGIAESIAADRTGRAYEAAIVPDEEVPVDWVRYDQADDPVLGAGVRWLRTRLP